MHSSETIEDIINSWKKEKVSVQLSDLEHAILRLFYERTKRTPRGVDLYELVLNFGERDKVYKAANRLRKKALIRKPRDADVYLIARKGYAVFESDFDVYSGILKSVYKGHVKRFKEVYINFIGRGISMYNFGLLKVYLRELADQGLLEFAKAGEYENVKITSLGKKVVNFLKRTEKK